MAAERERGGERKRERERERETHTEREGERERGGERGREREREGEREGGRERERGWEREKKSRLCISIFHLVCHSELCPDLCLCAKSIKCKICITICTPYLVPYAFLLHMLL